MKILHVVESLNKGAVENWLVNTFLEVKKLKPDWEWTFYCILPQEGRLDKMVTENGGTILYSEAQMSQKSAFLKSFRTILKKTSYDVVHVHHDYVSGFYLLAAIGLGYKKKTILHLHNMEKGIPTNKKILRMLLLPLFRISALKLSSLVLGNSVATVNDFVKNSTIKKRPLYYGIDFRSKIFPKDISWLKKSLHLGENDRVLLFVGRLYGNKNPVYCVDILHEINKIATNYYLVYVGEGEDDIIIKRKAQDLKLENKVIFMGWRNDVFDIMQGSDLLLFPRLEEPMEGFGLNIVEAQASGLPSLISYGVPEDVVCIEKLVQFMSIRKPAKEWAHKAAEMIDGNSKMPVQESLDTMTRSKVDIGFCAASLVEIYTPYSN